MASLLTKRVLKVMGMFSGAEAFGILCSVVKMKIVALWLSATGVGLFGIFNSTVDTVSIITGLGLRTSGVREVAKCNHSRNKLVEICSRLRGWSLLSGTLGALAVSLLSPWLSLFLFGNMSCWWQFMILSAALMLNSIIGGEQAILQGTEQFQRLARANVRGSFLGLAISVPMFRWLGNDSVVYSIIAYSLSILFFLFIYRNKTVPYHPVNINCLKRDTGFVKLGGYIALALFATNLAHLVFMSWLNRNASTTEVGFFQAGNTLVFRYTSIIFSAVGLEFYPRMSANNHSPHRMSLFVSHEISLLLKIFTPMLLAFLICRRWLVHLLYTSDFMVILPFITIAIFTIILRSVSTCMAFTIISKGEGRTYLFTESIDAIIGVCLSVWLYSHYGLVGIGIAQVIWYSLYTLMIGFIYFSRYHLSLSKGSIMVVSVAAVISVAATCVVLMNGL